MLVTTEKVLVKAGDAAHVETFVKYLYVTVMQLS